MSSAPDVQLGRRSTVMAAGTTLSRLTGFLRVLALAYALGYNRFTDAYNLANTLPNIVYELVLGGVVSATLVPIFVDLFDDDDDPWRGVAAVTWLVLAVTAGLSLLFALGAPLLAAPYAALNHAPQADAQRDLTIAFMRYFAPQVVLLAGMAVGSAILLARRRFAAPMFAPVLNNVVAIGALLAAPHVISRAELRSLDPRTGGLLLLGLGTTLGYAAQLVGLVPSLRNAGARFRPVWEPRHPAVRRAASLAGWTFGFVIANQIAYLIVVALANRRGGELSSYQSAFQFFQLPHAIVAVSITSALLPEMSAAAQRDPARFNALFFRGLRVTALLMVPAAVVAALFAEPLLRPFLSHGRMTEAALQTTAHTLAAFALGLPGFSAFILCTRALQARTDTRRVFYLYAIENGINVALALALYPSFHVRGLAWSYAAAYTIAAVIAYGVVMQTGSRVRGLP